MLPCFWPIGHPVAVTGLLGAANQELFVRLFAEKGLIDRFVRVPGHTRVNVKVVDEVGHRVTDINFPGITTHGEDLGAVSAAIDTLKRRGREIFVLSGSLPAGASPSIYRELVTRLKASNT